MPQRALESLERRLSRSIAHSLETRWQRHITGAPRSADGAGVPSPTDCARMRAIGRDDVEPSIARRAEMLWRHCAIAVVDRGTRASESHAARVTRRNRAARELGFESYWALWLEVEELDSSVVSRWLDPATELAHTSFGAVGGDAADAVRGAAELTSTAGLRVDFVATEVSRTYLIDPPRDVRVVSGRPATPSALRAFAHELGHAVYACSHRGDLPWSLADSPTRWLHEGFAEHVADRLVGRGGVDPGHWRWLQLCARFERDMYADERVDADELWRQHHRCYLGCEPHRSWRDIRHFIDDPGPRYVAAEVLRADLGVALGSDRLPVLREMMAAGASQTAEQLLRAARA